MSKILCLLISFFVVSLTAQAQTKPPEKDQPKEASKPAQSDTIKDVQDTMDLDTFFKKGEENAKKGSSCEKPAEPIA